LPEGALEEVLDAFKANKITKREVSKAIADLADGVIQDTLERIQEKRAAERSKDHEEQEA
jgi:hypothetical protein